jgi:hypothetical protein
LLVQAFLPIPVKNISSLKKNAYLKAAYPAGRIFIGTTRKKTFLPVPILFYTNLNLTYTPEKIHLKIPFSLHKG